VGEIISCAFVLSFLRETGQRVIEGGGRKEEKGKIGRGEREKGGERGKKGEKREGEEGEKERGERER
jgi:hypothetical protein